MKSRIRPNIQSQQKQDLSQLPREELEAKIHQLTAHNRQLKNLLNKANEIKCKTYKKIRRGREFDFSKHSKRHVLLKFAYLGWDRQGFTVQEDSLNTVEAALFEALLTTKLIESRETSNYHRCGRTDKGVSAFSQVISITVRSRLGKVEKAEKVEGEEENENVENGDIKKEDLDKEINYSQTLNRVLPPDIRVLAWSPIDEGFSARFNCTARTYKYFFPLGNLNLDAMNKAAQYLLGENDYRNLCKMDIGNGVIHFKRKILNVSIHEMNFAEEKLSTMPKCPTQGTSPTLLCENPKFPTLGMSPIALKDGSKFPTQDISPTTLTGSPTSLRESSKLPAQDINPTPPTENPTDPTTLRKRHTDPKPTELTRKVEKTPEPWLQNGYKMCVATIEGVAFLWHQVRAIMTILLLVGEGKEEPEIVKKLLDVDAVKRKPQYGFAHEVGLNLYDTQYENVTWRYDEENTLMVISQLQAIWAENAIKSSMCLHMLHDLSLRLSLHFGPPSLPPSHQGSLCQQDPRTKVYKPILQRPTCESLEERVKHFIKRRRLDPAVLDQVQKEEESEGEEMAASDCC